MVPLKQKPFSEFIAQNKIDLIFTDFNKNFTEDAFLTKEDIAINLNESLNKYHRTLDRAFFLYNQVAAGSLPSLAKMNSDFAEIEKDLSILYKNLKTIRETLGSSFNALAGTSLKLKSNIAEISSLLIDYRIQTKNKNRPTSSDSFLDLSKTESLDKFYTKPKAFLDTYNGNVVLGLNGEAESIKIKNITIADDSVGISGNNQEIGSIARDNLKLAIDGNIDTWFEFEQVNPNQIENHTMLDLVIEFEEAKIFNLLEIVPVFFPSGTYPGILEIRGSIDNSVYFDLKKLYLGDLSYDSYGQEIIQLGENSLNPSLGSLLYFTPKKVKFIHLKITEDTPYFIKTTSGIKRRKAIGIRELNFKAQKFNNESQFITQNFALNNEIAKIGLFTQEYMPNGFESTFDYSISVDDGKTWSAISPSQKIKKDIPEILNYNIDFLPESKKTNFPVTSFRLKADIKISQDTSRLGLGSNFISVKKTEFKNFVPGLKTFPLEEAPHSDVKIKQLGYGSVGHGAWYRIQPNNIKKFDDKTVIQLPLEVFPPSSISPGRESIKIEDSIWTRVVAITPASLPNEEIYEFDYLNNTITFSRNFNQQKDSNNTLVFKGKNPGTEIYFRLEREAATIENDGSSLLIKTDFNHSGIKEDIKVYHREASTLNKDFTLRHRSSIHRLNLEEVVSIQKTKDAKNLLMRQCPFINGVIELVNSGDYSFNDGTLYTQRALENDEEVILNLIYHKRDYIDFDIVDENIKIKLTDYKTRKADFNVTLPSSAFVVNLGYTNIEPKSIIMLTTNSAMVTEVPYEKMEESFNNSSIDNPYAIDYRNGIIYFKTKVSGNFAGTLNLQDYYVEYGIAYAVPDSMYSIKKTEKLIDFSDKFISDFFNTTLDKGLAVNLVKVSYSYLQELKESNTELLPYTTPFLMSYEILTTPKGEIV